MIIGMGVFYLDVDDISNRLNLMVTLALTAVAYKFLISGRLPRVCLFVFVHVCFMFVFYDHSCLSLDVDVVFMFIFVACLFYIHSCLFVLCSFMLFSCSCLFIF